MERTGHGPNRCVLLTSLLLVSTSETESEPKLLTKISPPSGLRARCMGVLPTSSRANSRSELLGRASSLGCVSVPLLPNFCLLREDAGLGAGVAAGEPAGAEIGRASCRERG